MFTATKDKALLTTTTGALPRPSWYTENLRGLPLSRGLSQRAYREQHFDCLACHVAAQHRAGIDIMVDGDTRLDDDVAGRSWVSYATSKDKKVALGVISHRTLQIERPEEVADLIRRALEHIEPERLILTSDCGFGRQSMSRMHAFYKMVALVRGTNIVRRELGLAEAHVPAMDAKLSMVPLP